MRDAESDAPGRATSTASAHLGFRVAVGLVGLALLALFILLGSVTMKQSATQQALESRPPPGEEARPALDGE